MTLVEVSLVVLLSVMLMTVVWGILSGGLRQSNMNVGRTEALMKAILILETVEEDLRHYAIKDARDLTLFDSSTPGQVLEFLTAHRAGEGQTGPLAEASKVSYRLQPALPENFLLMRNGTALGWARIEQLLFLPRKIDRHGGGNLHFVQMFVTTTDSDGKNALSFMGLVHVDAATDAKRYPYWNRNTDQGYLQFAP